MPPVASPQVQRTRRLLRQAQGYLELNMPQQALETLQRVTPGSFQAQWNFLLGQAHAQLGEASKAQEHLQRAAELAPSNPEIQLAWAQFLHQRGQSQQAVATLLQLLENHPEAASQAPLHYLLARAYSLLGKKEPMLWHLSKAVELEPGLRQQIAHEGDFRPFAHDPDFLALFSMTV